MADSKEDTSTVQDIELDDRGERRVIKRTSIHLRSTLASVVLTIYCVLSKMVSVDHL